jgi:hypothetical protein
MDSIMSRVKTEIPLIFVRMARSRLTLLAIAGMILPGSQLPGQETEHPFVTGLRSTGADGILVLLPGASPLAKEQTKGVHSAEAVTAVIPRAKVFLVDPETNAPAERGLIQKYGLGDSATTLAMDADGRPYAADLGLATAAETLTKFLTGAVAAKKKRDEAFATAAKAEGAAAYASFDLGLAAVPEAYWLPFYSKEIDRIRKGEPAAEPALREKYEKFIKRFNRQTDVKLLMAAVLESIDPNTASVDDVLKRFDHELAARNLAPESRQLAEMHRFRYLARAQRYDDALKSLDVAASLAPESELARNIPRFRDRIKAAMQKPKPADAPAEKPKDPPPTSPPPP